eukprot:scaffold7551_cov123-Isochrysis_galbana.AAC.5
MAIFPQHAAHAPSPTAERQWCARTVSSCAAAKPSRPRSFSTARCPRRQVAPAPPQSTAPASCMSYPPFPL